MSGESEVTSPERRGFILVLGAMSLLFLAVEGAGPPDQPGYVLAAQLVMSALLLATPPLLGRARSPRAVRWLVHGISAGVCLAFGAVAWGTGGTDSPYFAFLPMLPLVFTIAVPDMPLASLVAGACAGGAGLARVAAEALRAPRAAFWVLAFSTTTTYAVIGSIFHRRQRARERRLVEERARAEAVLAESERQRARAERLALVGRLAAGIAADVARPLSAISASAGEIERRAVAACGRDPDLALVFGDVRAALERIRRTVEDLQGFAEADIEAGEDCDLAAVLEEARLTLEQRFRAAVDILREPTPALPPLRAVRARLVHALVWIMVDASGRGVRRLRLAARPDGAEVLLELDDHGAGPSAATLDLPAAAVREAGLALALAREELARAGCHVEPTAPGGELRTPLRIRCAAGTDAEDRGRGRSAIPS